MTLIRRRWMAMGAAFALVLAIPTFTNVWVVRYARPHTFDRVADVPSRSVAIVPGARVYLDGTVSPMLEDRLATALDLYGAGRVSSVIVSGDHAAAAYDETAAMRQWLLDRGVPDARIQVDGAGYRTLDTMRNAVTTGRVRDAVVCTQRFHLARSVFLARRIGIDAVGLVADRRRYTPASERESTVREWLARTSAWVESYVLARTRGTPGA